jgi:hypothetical protein
MDMLSSDADLRSNSCLRDEYTAHGEVCRSSDGSAADCRAVLLSERGLFLDGLKGMLGKGPISVIGEGHTIAGLLAAVRTQPVPELVICHIASDQKPVAALDLISRLRQHFLPRQSSSSSRMPAQRQACR